MPISFLDTVVSVSFLYLFYLPTASATAFDSLFCCPWCIFPDEKGHMLWATKDEATDSLSLGSQLASEYTRIYSTKEVVHFVQVNIDRITELCSVK